MTSEELQVRCAYLEKVIAEAHVELDRAKTHPILFSYAQDQDKKDPFGTSTKYLADRVRVLVESNESWAGEALSNRGEINRAKASARDMVNRAKASARDMEVALSKISALVPEHLPLSAYRRDAELYALPVEDKDKLLDGLRQAVGFARDALERARRDR